MSSIVSYSPDYSRTHEWERVGDTLCTKLIGYDRVSIRKCAEETMQFLTV